MVEEFAAGSTFAVQAAKTLEAEREVLVRQLEAAEDAQFELMLIDPPPDLLLKLADRATLERLVERVEVGPAGKGHDRVSILWRVGVQRRD